MVPCHWKCGCVVPVLVYACGIWFGLGRPRAPTTCSRPVACAHGDRSEARARTRRPCGCARRAPHPQANLDDVMLALSSSCLSSAPLGTDPSLEASILLDKSYSATSTQDLHKSSFPYFLAPTLPHTPTQTAPVPPDTPHLPVPAVRRGPHPRSPLRPPPTPGPWTPSRQRESLKLLVHTDAQRRRAHVTSALSHEVAIKQVLGGVRAMGASGGFSLYLGIWTGPEGA